MKYEDFSLRTDIDKEIEGLKKELETV